MPGLTFHLQQESQSILKVLGAASDKGYPEPTTIESVTVHVDNGATIDATLGSIHKQGTSLVRDFSAELQRPPPGAHVVVVTATNEHGISVTKKASYSDGVAWPSHNVIPPSLVYPPDGSKWWPRPDLPGVQNVVAPNGKAVSIIELRGWLRGVADVCNGGDPDWHYMLEVDIDWLDHLGLNAEALLLPGDSLSNESDAASVQSEVLARSSTRAIYTLPLLLLELDAWPRADTDRGQPSKPTTWTFSNDCNGGDAVWPYNPLNPNPGDAALHSGQYVRVVGSLVTDEPHMSQDQLVTNYVLRFGFQAAVNLFGAERARGGQTNAIRLMWGGNRGELDPTHPARWNEVHSPDYIAVCQDKVRSETVRCVAIVAQNGLFSGDVESLSAKINAPPRPTPWHVLSTRKRIGSSTIASTVQVDELIPLTDGVRIRVQVQGQAGLGASGKFFAIYRVGWRGIAPALHAAVSGNGTAMLGAVDADGHVMVRPGTNTPPYWPSAWLGVQRGRCTPGGHVTLVSRSPDLFDAFHVGNDRVVYTAAQGAGPWAGWWQIAGISAPIGAPIHAVSRRLDHLDVFVADDSGRVMSAAWEPGFTSWHGWWHIQNGMTAPGGHVSAVSRSIDKLDIFCAGTDGRAYTAAWSAGSSGWAGWWAIGDDQFAPGAPLTAVSRSADKLDLFGADLQGRILATAWEPGASGWQPWTRVLNGTTSPGGKVAAACRRPDQIDIFAIGTDGYIYTAAWDATERTWHGWWRVGGIRARQGTPIEAFSPAPDVLVVVTSDEAGYPMSTTWSPGTGWVPWQRIDDVQPRPEPSTLRVSVTPRRIPVEQAVTLTVHVTDSITGADVTGQVKIGGVIVANTNTPFTYEFVGKRVLADIGPPKIWEVIYPEGVVVASGYGETPVDFGLP